MQLRVIDNVANGIGDALMYCWVLHSLAAAGHTPRFCPRRNEEVFRLFGVPPSWFSLEGGREPAPAKGDDNRTWLRQWLDEYGYPGLEPVRPPFVESPEETEWARGLLDARPGPHRVVVFPSGIHPSRMWPTHNFLSVIRSLEGAGVGTIAMLPKQTSPPWPSYAVWGVSVSRMAHIIREADLVICNESGPAHFAGTLGTPAVVVCGPSPAKQFLGHYDCLTIVQADPAEYPCVGCNWRGSKGYVSATCGLSKQCAALYSVTPSQVVDAARRVLDATQPKRLYCQ